MRNERQGCLAGLFELIMMNTLFDWLQDTFGFGKGCTCSGLGCGILLLILFVLFSCGIVGNTNWLKLF